VAALASLDYAQFGSAAVRVFAVSERMNQEILEHLDTAAWKAKTPGNTRTIAAIFTHVHNIRCKWVRLSAPHLGVPALLNRARCTREEAAAGLAESAVRCGEMLGEAMREDGAVKVFLRDGWAQPWAVGWPAGLEMLCYMISHEAHHRGQVCMLAHQLGFPLPMKVMSGIWNWERLLKLNVPG
jgi:uncharacterized damage-inducible protein DinB